MPGSTGLAVLPVLLPALLPVMNSKSPVPNFRLGGTTASTSGLPVLPSVLPVSENLSTATAGAHGDHGLPCTRASTEDVRFQN